MTELPCYHYSLTDQIILENWSGESFLQAMYFNIVAFKLISAYFM